MDGIKHCKLTKNMQRRLLEFFVLEVTAHSAADFLEIQPNTAILFYKKIFYKKIRPDSIVYTDSYKSYDMLDASTFRHERISHAQEFADGKNHINGINRQSFPLFLKECEFRFNYGTPRQKIKTLRKWCQI